MRFWLIQRGEWNPYNKNIKEITALTGKNGLINLSYMGSSEFEWGTIPRAYRRIMSQFEQYKLMATDITNINGVPLNIYCRGDQYEDIVTSLKDFIKSPYNLKEWTNLDKSFDKAWTKQTTSFWWCVDKGNDFMFFFGANDRASDFMKTITNDYENWWLAKDEEVRKTETKDSFDGAIF